MFLSFEGIESSVLEMEDIWEIFQFRGDKVEV
jgi:hypothetical protein